MKRWPSRAFWQGVGSIFNLAGGTRRHFDCGPYRFTVSSCPEEAARLDAEALASDWRVVGRDFQHAMTNQPTTTTPFNDRPDTAVGGTRKIADLPPVSPPTHVFCSHPEHNPPAHQVFTPGVYEHVCPGCHRRLVFTVNPPTF